MTKQYITRAHSFDAAHRVMGHIINDNKIDEFGINHSKCINFHGHRYDVELSFEFQTTGEIGYEIDFAEIKRRACQWIDDFWDHGAILNPNDKDFIDVCISKKSKLWIMKLGGGQWCNPTAENISKELFLICEQLFKDLTGLKVFSVKLYETAKCLVETFPTSISEQDRIMFQTAAGTMITDYAKQLGTKVYFQKEQ